MSARIDQATDDGIVAGLQYAEGFLLGVGTAFTDHGDTELARAFTAAAEEMGRVTPARVRRDWPKQADSEAQS